MGYFFELAALTFTGVLFAATLSVVKFNGRKIGKMRAKYGLLKKTERIVHVTRGNYSSMAVICENDSSAYYLVDGPTGCGKSTFAMLQLLKDFGKTMLIVSPTEANCVNLMNEYNKILRYSPFTTFSVEMLYIDFSKSTARCRLMTTTYESLVRYIRAFGALPDFSYLVLDEYHLATASVRAIFRFCTETATPGVTVITVSATPLGKPVASGAPPLDLVIVRSSVPDLSSVTDIVGTVLDPLPFRESGPGCFAVATSSTLQSDHLEKVYKKAGHDVFKIDARTSASKVVSFFSHPQKGLVVLYDPAVQAGITIPMSVLILPAVASESSYDGYVIRQRVRDLTDAEFTQSLGRAGRVYPTTVITPNRAGRMVTPNEEMIETTASVFFRSLDLQPAGVLYHPAYVDGRLKRMSHDTACIVLDLTGKLGILVAMTHVSDSGKPIDSSSKAYYDTNKDMLRLYTYTNGFFVAPVFDFSGDTDPSKFSAKEQAKLRRLMTDDMPTTFTSLDAGLDVIFNNVSIYTSYLVTMWEEFNGKKDMRIKRGLKKMSDTEAQKTIDKWKSDKDFPFGPAWVTFAAAVDKSKGASFSFDEEITQSDDKTTIILRIWLNLPGEKVVVNFTGDKFVSGNKYKEDVIAEAMLERVTQMVHEGELLMSDRRCDLTKYKNSLTSEDSCPFLKRI